MDKEYDKRENEENNTAQMSKEEQQLNQYIEWRISKEKKIHPFKYWLMKKLNILIYLKLHLASPALTVPFEFVFSSRGEVTRGRRNCLTENNLEREIFMYRNKKY